MNPAALDPRALATDVARFVLLGARLLPLTLIAPFAALGVRQSALSIALLLALTLCLWPAAQAPSALALSPFELVALCVRETLLGLPYALALGLALRALEWAGRIAGQSSALPGAAESYGALQLAFGVAAFFALGGQRIALAALAASLTRYPLGAVATLPDPLALALASARLFADAFSSAVLIALPVAGALALVEFGLALAARAAPALALSMLPLRTVLALALLALSALGLSRALPDYFARNLHAAQRVLGGP